MDNLFNIEIENLPRKKISETTRVTVLPPNTITDTGLKAKHVIDERIRE